MQLGFIKNKLQIYDVAVAYNLTKCKNRRYKKNVTEDSCLLPIKINCKLWSASPFATWQLGSFREKMF